jgi:hypothetical protein
MSDTPTKQTCKTCCFHQPNTTIELSNPGRCAWPPPPALARLYHILAQEPLARVDYARVFEDLPHALRSGRCGGWWPKPEVTS